MKRIGHPKHKIPWLADAIDWSFFENALEALSTKTGPRAHPIGVMVGGWMLKRLYYLGDETLMDRWMEHPDRPSFMGFDVMNHQPPGDSSDGRHS